MDAKTRRWARHIVILLVGFLIISVAQDVSAKDKTGHNGKKIIWYRAFFPPVTIPYGPDANTGFADRIQQFLVDHLQDYEHEFEVGNFRRIIQQLKAKKPCCCVTLFKTPEREKFIEFSVPLVPSFHNGVVLKKSDFEKFQPYLTEKNTISLEKLLQDNKLKLGIAEGRSYGPEIDSLLKKYSPSDHIYSRSGEDVFKGLLLMLISKRVDFVLGFPTEAQYQARKTGKGEDITFLPISEMERPYILGLVGCTKDDWGAEVIDKINAILETYRTSPEFLGFYEYWLDKDTIPRYREIVKEHLKDYRANQ